MNNAKTVHRVGRDLCGDIRGDEQKAIIMFPDVYEPANRFQEVYLEIKLYIKWLQVKQKN